MKMNIAFLLVILMKLFSSCVQHKPETPTIPALDRKIIEGTKGLRVDSDFHIQFTGDFSKMPNADVYDVGFQEESEVKNVKFLVSKKKYVICYMSAGSYEGGRADSDQFPKSAIGKKMAGWDEGWIDIRNNKILAVMMKRMDAAKALGCAAIDVDNVDGYTNNTGFPLTEADQIAYNIKLANYAHKLGMQIGLKNALKIAKKMSAYYDFAINEQCQEYKECHYYDDSFIKEKKPVFHIEYKKKNCRPYPGLISQLKKLSLDEYAKECK